LWFLRTSPTAAHLATRAGSHGSRPAAASSPSNGERSVSAFLACSDVPTPRGASAAAASAEAVREGEAASGSAAGRALRRGATAVVVAENLWS
jgi:hypothetical protein